MNNRGGQTLTPNVAQELIQELFAGQTAPLQQIKQKVDEVHQERGGILSSVTHHPVSRALSRMKKFGLADNIERGLWSILAKEQSQSAEHSQSEEQSQLKESDTIKTLNAFMEWVEELRRGDYVYRGVSNKDYQIEASTYRRLKDKNGQISEEDKSAEKLLQINWEMIEDANRHKHGWDNDQRPPDLNLLAKLQHSGAATCLIDFTKNPLVALWMACRKSGSGLVDGKVYAVKIAPDSPFQSIGPDEALNGKINDFFQRNEKMGYQLYQWQPDYQDNRMLAQQSVFLFGGGWGEIKPSAECVILEKFKQKIWDSLKKSAGISEDILFPDFEGFASQRAQNKAYNKPEDPIDKDPVLALPANITDKAIDSKKQTESSAIYYLHLSLQAYREGKSDIAFRYHSKVLEFNPSDELLSYFYRERAIISHGMGYLVSAVSNYDKAIHLSSNDADSYYGRGEVNYKLRRYTEAIADFGKAIKMNCSNKEYAYYFRGMAKLDMKQFLEAVENFDEAIKLDSTDARFYHWRGIATFNLERYREAVGDFEQAIGLNPTYVYSYHYRGMAKHHLQQNPAALLDFEEAINLNSTDISFKASSYYWRAVVQKEIGGFEAAKADFRAALLCAEETQNHELILQINEKMSS